MCILYMHILFDKQVRYLSMILKVSERDSLLETINQFDGHIQDLLSSLYTEVRLYLIGKQVQKTY